jgi:hypothetical protein
MNWNRVVESVQRCSPAGAALLAQGTAEERQGTIVLSFTDKTAHDRLMGNGKGLAMVEAAVRRCLNLRFQCRYIAAEPFDPACPTWAAAQQASDAVLNPCWYDHPCRCGQEPDMLYSIGVLPTDVRWACAVCGMLDVGGVVGAVYRSRWFGLCRTEEVRTT